MGGEGLPTCAIRETLEHERAWELRPLDPAHIDTFILFCPLCGCEVGSGTSAVAVRTPQNGAFRQMRRSLPHPHGERGREELARGKPAPAPPRCASCGRDIPRLPAPHPPQHLCAFCAKFSG